MSRAQWTSDKLFSRLLTNKTKKGYWDAITALRARASEEVYERAVRLARSDNERDKIVGIDVLAQLGQTPRMRQDKTVSLYFELLSQPSSPKVLSSLLSGIGHNNDKLTGEQISILSAYADHSYSAVRFALVHALLGLEHPDAIVMLICLSRDTHGDVRNWATFGLGSQIEVTTDEILYALLERTTDNHADTKLEAIVGLAERKDVRVKQIMLDELQKGAHGSLLFEAIEILGDKDFLMPLEGIMNSLNNDREVNPEWRMALEEVVVKLREG
ncbi:MAG: hypothetical protein AB8F78_19405 [Saprospiraceae bacterium]